MNVLVIAADDVASRGARRLGKTRKGKQSMSVRFECRDRDRERGRDRGYVKMSVKGLRGCGEWKVNEQDRGEDHRGRDRRE